MFQIVDSSVFYMLFTSDVQLAPGRSQIDKNRLFSFRPCLLRVRWTTALGQLSLQQCVNVLAMEEPRAADVQKAFVSSTNLKMCHLCCRAALIVPSYHPGWEHVE